MAANLHGIDLTENQRFSGNKINISSGISYVYTENIRVRLLDDGYRDKVDRMYNDRHKHKEKPKDLNIKFGSSGNLTYKISSDRVNRNDRLYIQYSNESFNGHQYMFQWNTNDDELTLSSSTMISSGLYMNTLTSGNITSDRIISNTNEDWSWTVSGNLYRTYASLQPLSIKDRLRSHDCDTTDGEKSGLMMIHLHHPKTLEDIMNDVSQSNGSGVYYEYGGSMHFYSGIHKRLSIAKYDANDDETDESLFYTVLKDADQTIMDDDLEFVKKYESEYDKEYKKKYLRLDNHYAYDEIQRESYADIRTRAPFEFRCFITNGNHSFDTIEHDLELLIAEERYQNIYNPSMLETIK